jgi:hypothetical protein
MKHSEAFIRKCEERRQKAIEEWRKYNKVSSDKVAGIVPYVIKVDEPDYDGCGYKGRLRYQPYKEDKYIMGYVHW